MAFFVDPPYSVLGFATIPSAYFPLRDPSIPPENVTAHFALYVSGYYSHGNSPEEYETRKDQHASSPPPTVTILTDEEREYTLHPLPGDPRGGSDQLLMSGAVQSGAFGAIRKNALRLPPASVPTSGDAWKDVEVRHLWCDRSVWLCQWAVFNMQRELKEERRAGTSLRNVTFFRVRGANHFVSLTKPR